MDATDNLFDDPRFADAAKLGWLEGELRRMGWRHADELSQTTTRLLERLNKAPQEIRVSEIQVGDEWFQEGHWVQVEEVHVSHPDDRVGIVYIIDGDTVGSTREYRGFEIAIVKR